MEIRNVIELSAFSKSLSKKITYLNHEERILIDIEQIAAITPSSEREDLPKKEYTILLFSNKNQFYLKCEAKEKWRLYVFARRMLQSKKKK